MSTDFGIISVIESNKSKANSLNSNTIFWASDYLMMLLEIEAWHTGIYKKFLELLYEHVFFEHG